MIQKSITSLLDTLDKKYLHSVDLSDILVDPEQPKQNVSIDFILHLADEIKSNGQVLPLVCIKKINATTTKEKKYIFLGELYFRALKLAGLNKIQIVLLNELPIEIIHLILLAYKDTRYMNLIEEIRLLKYLNEDRGLNHSELATRFNLTRSVITNRIRLLRLPVEVLYGVINKEITEGHARALLSLGNRELILNAYEIVKRDSMNVRQTEELVRRLLGRSRKPVIKKKLQLTDTQRKVLEKIMKKLDHKIYVQPLVKGGRLIIRYKSKEDLDLLLETLEQAIELL